MIYTDQSTFVSIKSFTSSITRVERRQQKMLTPLIKPNVRTVRDQSHFLFDDLTSNNNDRTRSFDSEASFANYQAETKVPRYSSINSHNSQNSNIELANHRLRRSATTARLRNNNASANALHCFKRCGCVISLLSFVLAIVVGVCGILNTHYINGRPQHDIHPLVNTSAKGSVVMVQTCTPRTGWNLSTGCKECQTNWNNADGLCNDCAVNHYGPNCRPCKCAVFDNSFELPNEQRALDCYEGVNGDGSCSIIAPVYIFFVVVSSVLGLVVCIHLLLLCDGVAQKCTRLTSSCPTYVTLCMNFTAGSVGKLPHRFRNYFVFSTVLISTSTFSVLYSVVGQNLSLSPRWMLIWSIAVFFINISNFSLLSLLIFEVGGELYARKREEQRKTVYKTKFMEQKDDVKRLQEGWEITEESITFIGDKPLGTGASAKVWNAKWEPLNDANATVAVKVLDSSGDLNELNKEIELMQRLSHTRLVHFFGAGKLSNDSFYGTSGTLYLVTELLHGGDLGSLLSDADVIQRWSWKARLQICVDIAHGMEYLHQHDVAHRDLKPGNVLLDRNKKRAKVADFGLAKLLSKKKKKNYYSNQENSNLSYSLARRDEEMDEELGGGVGGVGSVGSLGGTKYGVTGMLGSGPFMAPELWESRNVNVDPFKVDVYAMSVTLWMIMNAPEVPYVQQGWDTKFTYQLQKMVSVDNKRPLLIKNEEAERKRPSGYVMLMEQGWNVDCEKRPRMKIVVRELERMLNE